MATVRRPKKALIQFLVAGGIAVVLGIIVIVMIFMIFGAVTGSSQSQLAQAQAEAEKAKEEKEALEKSIQKIKTRQNMMKQTEVRAKNDIPAGTLISADMLDTVELDGQQRLPDGFPRDVMVIGKMTISDIKSGEAVSGSKLLNTEGLILPEPGKRAITIAIDPVAGLAGSLREGAYVDVLTTITADNATITKTILQNAKVIGVGALGGSGSSGASSVTLSVTPSQAEMLALANKEGQFHLTLRGFSDQAIADVTGSDVGQLVSGLNKKTLERPLPDAPQADHFISVSNMGPTGAGLPEPPAAVQPKTSTFTMEIFKGSNSEQKTFEVDN